MWFWHPVRDFLKRLIKEKARSSLPGCISDLLRLAQQLRALLFLPALWLCGYKESAENWSVRHKLISKCIQAENIRKVSLSPYAAAENIYVYPFLIFHVCAVQLQLRCQFNVNAMMSAWHQRVFSVYFCCEMCRVWLWICRSHDAAERCQCVCSNPLTVRRERLTPSHV